MRKENFLQLCLLLFRIFMMPVIIVTQTLSAFSVMLNSERAFIKVLVEVTDQMVSDPSSLYELKINLHEIIMPIYLSLPTKEKFADVILIFLCPPDEAEALVGDLLEGYEEVLFRHNKKVANAWFFWELIILLLAKAKNRLVKAALPKKIIDYFVRSAE